MIPALLGVILSALFIFLFWYLVPVTLLDPILNLDTSLNEALNEGFTPDSTTQFLELQRTINPHTNFDMAEIGQQASQEELDYYLKNQMWPWSNELQEMYKNAVESNPYVRLDPKLGVNRARVMYNEKIMWEILSWQTKEGQFLLNGAIVKDASSNHVSGFGDFPYSSELIKERYDVVKCDSSNVLMRTKNTGINPNTGAYETKMFPVDLGTLDKLVPGFSFPNKKQCNPCVALSSDYSCPFNLDIDGVKPGVSDVWKHLWQLS